MAQIQQVTFSFLNFLVSLTKFCFLCRWESAGFVFLSFSFFWKTLMSKVFFSENHKSRVSVPPLGQFNPECGLREMSWWELSRPHPPFSCCCFFKESLKELLWVMLVIADVFVAGAEVTFHQIQPGDDFSVNSLLTLKCWDAVRSFLSFLFSFSFPSLCEVRRSDGCLERTIYCRPLRLFQGAFTLKLLQ